MKLKLVVKITSESKNQESVTTRVATLLTQQLSRGFSEGTIRDEETKTQARYSLTVDK